LRYENLGSYWKYGNYWNKCGAYDITERQNMGKKVKGEGDIDIDRGDRQTIFGTALGQLLGITWDKRCRLGIV
jgi:hypothetical protein